MSSSAVLCNTSAIFVYLISLCLLKDTKADALKALSVVLSFSGIVIVTISDSKENSSSES